MDINNNSLLIAIKEVLNELNNIRRYRITINELNKAKKKIQIEMLFEFQTSYNYANYYSYRVLFNLPIYNINELYDQVETVNTVIKNIFNKDNIIIGTIGNNIQDEDSDEIISLIGNSFQ
jgi:predicted Zn-dependent peptidase